MPTPPLSLYIHIPWCVQKCPYCDFNSHQQPKQLPETEYIAALSKDLSETVQQYEITQPIRSIFFGGGTPSLFSASSIEKILTAVEAQLQFSDDIEITLEANPGTFEQQRFTDYKSSGVNRLSIGIQSFNAKQLKILGRIHNESEAVHAVEVAHQAGFKQINCDLMYALPNQTVAEAVDDLQQAFALQPTHVSWYHLTLEPNTVFYQKPPKNLPEEKELAEIEEAGHQLLATAGYQRYEISAYARNKAKAKHNMNYWLFGDYIGIGAGAHSKLTATDGKITRLWKVKTPFRYLNQDIPFVANQNTLSKADVIFEFMLNALRLIEGFYPYEFTERTGLPLSVLAKPLKKAETTGLLDVGEKIKPTELGLRFLNDLVLLFAPGAEDT